MNQTINLYQPEKPQKRDRCNAKFSVLVLLSSLLLLVLFGVINKHQLKTDHQQFTQLQVERQHLQQEFDALSDNRQVESTDPALLATEIQLQLALTEAKQRNQWLTDNPSIKTSWGPIFNQLIEAQDQGFRIATMTFISQQNSVQIEGTASAPAAINAFLQRISSTNHPLIEVGTLQLNKQGAAHHFLMDLSVTSQTQETLETEGEKQ